MSKTVTIVDYEIGNIRSIVNALEYFGATARMAATPEDVAAADWLILPGVGAFQDAMDALNARDLAEPVKAFAASGKPFLGICLGMEMMLDESDEFGLHQGLGIIPGRVEAIPAQGPDGSSHRIPHIGWSDLYRPGDAPEWEETILRGVPEGSPMYFVHSFAATTRHPEHCLAKVLYNGLEVVAAVARDNAYGCQFHPEKSGQFGLSIMGNFLAL